MNTEKRTPLYYKAPSQLREDITILARQFSSESRKMKAPGWNTWLRLALTPIGVAIIVVVTHSLSQPSIEDKITQDVVASHVRSLMVPNHLMDVPSSDKHTVKPWFNGKLDFSPSVPDLKEDGFALIGGRLDYLSDRSVAALVYQRREHKINLLIWPSHEPSDEKIKFTSRQGYSVFHWVSSGMNYWAVSDLNANELKQFSELIHKSAQ
jgi:anti-sigma factor RsiW